MDRIERQTLEMVARSKDETFVAARVFAAVTKMACKNLEGRGYLTSTMTTEGREYKLTQKGRIAWEDIKKERKP